jgi:hypothetical protein
MEDRGGFEAEKPTEKPQESGSKLRDALLLLLLLFVVYNANLRLIRIEDSIPNRLLPFSLLLDRSFYLDEWVKPYLPRAHGPYGIYFVRNVEGHWLSTYPVITSLVILPLYFVPAWWLSQQHVQPSGGDVVLVAVIDTMEKLSASLLAAASAVILYLALRKVAARSTSLAVSLIYGIASSTWTISSQALWRDGFSELCFALLLWVLLHSPTAGSYPFGVGFALAVAAANKPAYALLAALFLLYFARQGRERLRLFLLPLVVIGLLVLTYNFYFFGNLLGGYPNPISAQTTKSLASRYQISILGGLAGLLVSPSRGLLIYSPWVVFSLWGAGRLWKESTQGWGRYLLLGMVAVLLLHARLGTWWAGWCYGPRYLTDLLPFLAFFLIPVWSRIRAKAVLRGAFIVAVAVALWVQVVGAACFPKGLWDLKPVSMDRNPKRLWDWSDTQISRTWGAGRAEPLLYYEWWEFLSMQRPLPHRSAKSTANGSP